MTVTSPSMPGDKNLKAVRAARWLQILFFVSGAVALSYQVCWQRILFFSLGTDIESTTIIVSSFMLGLGLGALAGGWAADRFTGKIILLFALTELGIGLFGFASPHLLPYVSDLFILSGRAQMAAINFFLLLVPTGLMGATLPMLVTYFMNEYGNVGASTGKLYHVNTLGAALGCCLVGFVGFNYMPLDAVIMTAGILNILVAFTAFSLFGRRA